MEEIVEKFIRINAIIPMYGRVPYRFAVARGANGRFVTGQEEVLSEAQMLGNEPISKSNKDELKMGDDPWIISPDNIHTLVSGRKFDLSYKVVKGKKIYLNPKDYAEFTFFKLQPEVVETRKGAQKHKHFFYIEDKEKEHEDNVTFQNLVFEANAFVREGTSFKRLRDIALLLSYTTSKNINPDSLSSKALQSIIYDVCNTDPKAVLSCRSDESGELQQERLFALKTIQIGEVVHYEGSYYYGRNRNTYIGDNFNKVLEWIDNPKNASAVERLGKIVKEWEDKKEEDK